MMKKVIAVRNKILRFLFSKIYRKPENGIKVMDYDWNFLIILDACRYDYFEKEFYRRALFRFGKLSKVTSVAPNTSPWMERNFLSDNKTYKDVIYISGNPVSYLKSLNKVFFKVIEVWKYGWSEEFSTVLPVTIYRTFKRYYKLYPNKRFIIHFIQPHYPYLCYSPKEATLEELRQKLVYKRSSYLKSKDSLFRWYLEVPMANYSDTEIKYGYEYNLSVVLDWVEKIINEVKVKIVVTSDHGELLGERVFGIKVYGHPHFMHHKILLTVPWLEVNI